jgi:L-fuconolactonase
MLIIDSQVHAYERNHPGRPWVGVLTGPDEVTGDAMVAAMEAVGVAGAVLVSPFSDQRAHLNKKVRFRSESKLFHSINLFFD